MAAASPPPPSNLRQPEGRSGGRAVTVCLACCSVLPKAQVLQSADLAGQRWLLLQQLQRRLARQEPAAWRWARQPWGGQAGGQREGQAGSSGGGVRHGRTG